MKKVTYSKATFRGVIIFGVLCVVIFLAPDIIKSLAPKDVIKITELPEDVQEKIDKVQIQKERYKPRGKRKKYKAPPVRFNPNEYTLQDWKNLGLSEKQASVVLKFTKYPLKSNTDLKRIFVIPEELYNLIKDSTFYPKADQRMVYEASDRLPSKEKVNSVNVNTASIEELQTVKGIGPFFAKQIAKKRDELGGFYTTEQYMEVWKATPENTIQWESGLKIDENDIRRININTATAEELKAHPYITWNLANSIVKLRLQIGTFKTISDVKKSVLMTDELYQKLAHYLTVE